MVFCEVYAVEARGRLAAVIARVCSSLRRLRPVSGCHCALIFAFVVCIRFQDRSVRSCSQIDENQASKTEMQEIKVMK